MFFFLLLWGGSEPMKHREGVKSDFYCSVSLLKMVPHFLSSKSRDGGISTAS